jgi:hypothetical protein
MNRCKRCIIPDTVPGITLDDEGICNLCRSYKPPQYMGEEALDELVASIKGKGEHYDCIVPISGGRDSSFVLYTAAAKLGLRVLAVNYDNEFRADQAIRNIRTAAGKLGVDLLEIGSKRNIATKIVRHEIRHVLPQGLPAIIMVLCIACSYGYKAVTYRMAVKYRVPLVIWGSSQVEKSEDTAVRAFAEIQQRSGIAGSRSLFSKLFDWYYHLLQRIEFHVPGNPILADRPVTLNNPNVKEISLFDYLPWDRHLIKETIMSKLDWRKPEDHVSTWRTDCILHDMVAFCFVNPLGCSKACFGYSNMINSNQMTREEALAQEEAVSGRFSRSLELLLRDRIGLSGQEIERIKRLETALARS